MSSPSGVSGRVKVLLLIGFVVAAGLVGFGAVSFLHTRENVRLHQEAVARKPNDPGLLVQVRQYEDEHDTAKLILGAGGLGLLLWVGALALVLKGRGA
jgi:hypothetical protein